MSEPIPIRLAPWNGEPIYPSSPDTPFGALQDAPCPFCDGMGGDCLPCYGEGRTAYRKTER